MFSIWSLLLWVALVAVAQSEIEFPNAITAEFITIAHQIPEVGILFCFNRIDLRVSSARETLLVVL